MKLKSIILVTISLFIFSACSPTKEEKAQKIVAHYLKDVLYDFNNYEPLETKVDSSFVALSTDKEAIELTRGLIKLFQSAQIYADKMKQAERSMEIWFPSEHSSAHTKGEYRRAKEDRDNNQRLLDKTKDQLQKQFSKIKSRQSYLEAEASLKMGDFDGWKVYHKFRILNETDSVDFFGEYIFFCDEDFNDISAYSKEEYDAIDKIITAFSSSGNITEMIENIQDSWVANGY